MTRIFSMITAIGFAVLLSTAHADNHQPDEVETDTPATDTAVESETREDEGFRNLDADIQALKQSIIDINRDLFLLEEDLLFPASTQISVFVSMDVGFFFALDSVQLTVAGTKVASYLYTPRETESLIRGGVQRLYTGNLPTGEHELIAIFTGIGPNGREYRRGATLNVKKELGPKFVELIISDQESREQPAFIVKEW